jgi:hypothetical protein
MTEPKVTGLPSSPVWAAPALAARFRALGFGPFRSGATRFSARRGRRSAASARRCEFQFPVGDGDRVRGPADLSGPRAASAHLLP